MNQTKAALSHAMCRDARRLLHLSQEEMASLANVSVSTLRRLERGERISDYAAQRIFDALVDAGIDFFGTENSVKVR